jgi:hypothetical protein
MAKNYHGKKFYNIAPVSMIWNNFFVINVRQNKLERLFLASIFRQVKYVFNFMRKYLDLI